MLLLVSGSYIAGLIIILLGSFAAIITSLLETGDKVKNLRLRLRRTVAIFLILTTLFVSAYAIYDYIRTESEKDEQQEKADNAARAEKEFQDKMIKENEARKQENLQIKRQLDSITNMLRNPLQNQRSTSIINSTETKHYKLSPIEELRLNGSYSAYCRDEGTNEFVEVDNDNLKNCSKSLFVLRYSFNDLDLTLSRMLSARMLNYTNSSSNVKIIDKDRTLNFIELDYNSTSGYRQLLSSLVTDINSEKKFSVLNISEKDKYAYFKRYFYSPELKSIFISYSLENNYNVKEMFANYMQVNKNLFLLNSDAIQLTYDEINLEP